MSNTSTSELSAYLNKSIGDYSYKNLISDKLLANHRNNTNSLFAAGSSVKNNLSRIYLIEFSANIDAEMLSKKLSSFGDVEYAEPDYIRSINYIPNDTLLYEQDYLVNTETYEAWAYLEDSGLLEDYLSRDILVGIVDTGIDRDHIEFKDVLYQNTGEMGTDDNGNDKTSNGIDDDSNGFVDDWQGWDFVSGTSESGEDNDPSPGHPHGTHVGGVISAINNNIAGIAGIGINMKLLPVKIGFDSQFSTSVANSYDGILYAAMRGADIINCSWGGSNASKAEQDVIKAAMSLGSLVIAAAGNDASHRPQHPASIDGVISVAASDYTDKYASFTNYDESVDVSAPGFMVLSTVPNNGYAKWNGTSMASPVAAAVAGWLKRRFRDKSPEDLGDMLQSSTRRIDFLNSYRPGLMGTGVVSTFKALTDSNFQLLKIQDHSFLNQFGEDIFRFGDTINLNLSIKNQLDPLQGVTLLSYETFMEYLDILDDNSKLGDFSENETKYFANTLKFVVKEEDAYDRLVTITLVFNAEDGYKEYKSLSFIINPTYLTFNRNDIMATFNSRGNIAYNDYSANTQGVGFEYKGSSSLLFEGAFMAAVPGKLSDVARNSIGNSQNRSFTPQVVLNKNENAEFSEGNASFYSESDSLTLGIELFSILFSRPTPHLKM